MSPYTYNLPPVPVYKMEENLGLDGEYKNLLKQAQKEEADRKAKKLRLVEEKEARKEAKRAAYRAAQALKKKQERQERARRLKLGGTAWTRVARNWDGSVSWTRKEVALPHERIPLEAEDVTEKDRNAHNDRAMLLQLYQEAEEIGLTEEVRQGWEKETVFQVRTQPYIHAGRAEDDRFSLHCDVDWGPEDDLPPSQWTPFATGFTPEQAKMIGIMKHVRARRVRELRERFEADERRLGYR